MTHGRTAKIGRNSRSKKGKSDVFGLTPLAENQEKSLESRVAALEDRIDQMQEEIDRISGIAVPAQIQEAIDNIGKPRTDTRQKINEAELLLNRDNLVRWLEEHWPKIVKPLLAAKNPSEIFAVMEAIAAPPDIRPTWQVGIIDNPAKLLEFLRSEKFRRRPPKKTITDALALYKSERRQRAANRLPTRQIANAMAGVPQLKWRTSFDKCVKVPSPCRVGHNTATHYRAALGVPE
jgi:TolA-binding protein